MGQFINPIDWEEKQNSEDNEEQRRRGGIAFDKFVVLNVRDGHAKQRHGAIGQGFEVGAAWTKQHVATKHKAKKHEEEQNKKINHIFKGHLQRPKDGSEPRGKIQVFERSQNEQDGVHRVQLLHGSVPNQQF